MIVVLKVLLQWFHIWCLCRNPVGGVDSKELGSKNLNPHPPSVENAWRLEPGFQTPWYQPKTPTEEVPPPPQPATAPESAGNQSGGEWGCWENRSGD